MESELNALTAELLGRLPTMTGEERRLGLEIYRQLVRGEPVATPELAHALDTRTDTVEDLLGKPNLKSLTYLDPGGRIIGFGGLAVREMSHRLKVDGRTLYTWCAWDSLFIPVILGVESEVVSPPPGGGSPVRLRVAPNGIKDLQPSSAVMSFLLPSAQTFQTDALKAMASFCHYIFFFASREAATHWVAGHPDTSVISITDAFELGRSMVAARWYI